MNFFRSARTSCTTFSWSVRVQEFFLLLLFLLLLLLSSHPWLALSPWWPHPSPRLLLLFLLLLAGLLQMIIWRGQLLANHHLEGLASCKWSSGGTSHLQMIIGHPVIQFVLVLFFSYVWQTSTLLGSNWNSYKNNKKRCLLIIVNKCENWVDIFGETVDT